MNQLNLLGSVVHYVGIMRDAIVEDGHYEVLFLHMSTVHRKACAFMEQIWADMNFHGAEYMGRTSSLFNKKSARIH